MPGIAQAALLAKGRFPRVHSVATYPAGAIRRSGRYARAPRLASRRARSVGLAGTSHPSAPRRLVSKRDRAEQRGCSVLGARRAFTPFSSFPRKREPSFTRVTGLSSLRRRDAAPRPARKRAAIPRSDDRPTSRIYFVTAPSANTA